MAREVLLTRSTLLVTPIFDELYVFICSYIVIYIYIIRQALDCDFQQLIVGVADNVGVDT